LTLLNEAEGLTRDVAGAGVAAVRVERLPPLWDTSIAALPALCASAPIDCPVRANAETAKVTNT